MNEFEAAVSSKFDRLTDTQKRVAEYVWNNVDKVVFMTVDEIGRELSVSPSTIVRFCTAIGFDGFAGLQRYLQQIVKTKLAPAERVPEGGHDLSAADRVVDASMAHDIRALELTREYLSNHTELGHAADLIINARRRWVLGYRVSFSVAYFLYASLLQLLGDTELLGIETGLLSERVAEIRKDDVAIIFSFPRYATIPITVAEHLNTHGVPIVAITDSPLSPVGRMSTVVLPVHFEGLTFQNSLVPALSVCSALANMLFLDERVHRKSRELLDRTEQVMSSWKVLSAHRSGKGGGDQAPDA